MALVRLVGPEDEILQDLVVADALADTGVIELPTYLPTRFITSLSENDLVVGAVDRYRLVAIEVQMDMSGVTRILIFRRDL